MIRFPHSHSLSTPSFFLSARLGHSQIHNHDYILHSSQQSTYRTHCTLHNFFHDMFNAKILKYTGNDHTSGDNFFPYDIIASRPALCNSASLQLQLCSCSSTVLCIVQFPWLKLQLWALLCNSPWWNYNYELRLCSAFVQYPLMELQLRALSLFCYFVIPIDGTTTTGSLSVLLLQYVLPIDGTTTSGSLSVLLLQYVLPIDRTLTMGSLSALLLCM